MTYFDSYSYLSNLNEAVERFKSSSEFEELEYFLQNNKSYLTSECRPDLTPTLQEVLDKLDDKDRIVILDALDDCFIYSLINLLKN